MDLLCIPTRLGFPLLGGGELGTQISTQPSLLGEAVPLRLPLAEKPGFVPATGNKTLKTRLKNTKTQGYEKKEENEADTRLEGTMISRRAPLSWFKAFITAKNRISRFSRSMLSATSSSENRADVGS